MGNGDPSEIPRREETKFMVTKRSGAEGEAMLKTSTAESGGGPAERDRGLGGFVRLTLLAFIAAMMVLTVTASPGLAQTPQEPSDPAGRPMGSTDAGSEAPPAGRGPTDEREVEAFLDGYFAQQLESSKIPGATVSVVRDGEVLFAKGYGEADVEAKEPVVADETLFRVGSVSKLFTSTAAMQLVEEGKLDLDEDVNRYLDDVEIPDTYPGQPVTLRNLLTHTAGFEQEFVGSGARTEADYKPLGEYLAGIDPPARVRPPGEVTSYSNYGMALIGRIVEEQSGMTFAQYVEQNVTAPLGMDGTTAAQPLEPGLRDRLAQGYTVEGGGPTAEPFEYIEEAPAGSVSSTATDMARFMIAQLQNGRYGDARILQEDTAKQMQTKQFSSAPGLSSGMGFGFYGQTVNGERVIEHGGNTFLYHSIAVLLPKRNVGLFVSYNSYGEGEAGARGEYDLTRAFLDRYYPEEAPPSPELPADEGSVEGASGDAERVAGSYRSTRGNETGLEKVFDLASLTSVAANGDGSITTNGVMKKDLTTTEQRWVPDGPMTFRIEGGDERLAFKEGEEGATYLATDADPTSALEKVPFLESARLHLGLLGGGLVVLLLTALVWPARALTSWWYGRRYRKLHGEELGGEPKKGAGGARLARVLAWVLCTIALSLAVALVMTATNPLDVLFFGDSPILLAVRVLPYLIAALAVGVAVFAALSWRRGYWGLFGRLHYSLVAVAALTFTALLGYYNLLGL